MRASGPRRPSRRGPGKHRGRSRGSPKQSRRPSGQPPPKSEVALGASVDVPAGTLSVPVPGLQPAGVPVEVEDGGPYRGRLLVLEPPQPGGTGRTLVEGQRPAVEQVL